MNKASYLSKSDFKSALSCPVKLYYKKNRYPSNNDENEYLALLADGGFIIGEWAKSLYPHGVEIKTKSIKEAARETLELLKQEHVILFEPALRFGPYLARVDVLVKEGNQVKLIEVKSKSATSNSEECDNPFRGKRGSIESGWKEYLQDVAFQTMVARGAYPSWSVTPFLLIPDKDKTVKDDGLHKLFRIHKTTSENGRHEITVENNASPEVIANNNFLTHFNVSPEVESLMQEVIQQANLLAGFLGDTIKKPSAPIGHACKSCEYRLSDPAVTPNGFIECWGNAGQIDPHIFDLYNIREKVSEPLIAQGRCGLYDIDPDSLGGKIGARQQLQLHCMKNQEEWHSDELRGLVQGAQYPLHFIDFEGTRMALPYHGGTPPFDLVAFQWSCHTVDAPCAQPVQSEWLNTEDRYPNVEFARTLMETIGDSGTVMVWSPYEKTAIRHVAEELQFRRALSPQDTVLSGWLNCFVENYETRCIDLCKWTKEHYYHPEMKGSNSIKAVLPAIWKNNPALHAIPWFSPYVSIKAGVVEDPYKSLPAMKVYERAEVIKEGTGAMRAYEEMIYGDAALEPEAQKSWARLLLQYCELDTIAMLMIWEHWRRL